MDGWMGGCGWVDEWMDGLLTRVWFVVDHKPPKKLQRSPKLKMSH